MSNIQTYYHFQLDFQKVDQHTGASGYSTVPNVARTISCKACNSPVEDTSGECKHDMSPKVAFSIQYLGRISRGRNIQGVAHLQNQNYLVTESLQCSSKSNEWPQKNQ